MAYRMDKAKGGGGTCFAGRKYSHTVGIRPHMVLNHGRHLRPPGLSPSRLSQSDSRGTFTKLFGDRELLLNDESPGSKNIVAPHR